MNVQGMHMPAQEKSGVEDDWDQECAVQYSQTITPPLSKYHLVGFDETYRNSS